jgi:hypothetical protein
MFCLLTPLESKMATALRFDWTGQVGSALLAP